MAATGTPTPNIGLRRAQGTDPASVDDINYNSALIDTKLGAVGNSSVQDQIDTLNSKIANPLNIQFSNITGTSQSTFESALTTALNGMNTGDVRCCSAYANYSQSLTNGGQSIAFIYKQTSSVWWCFLVMSGNVKVGYYMNSTWAWL